MMNQQEKKYHFNLSEYFLSKPLWFDDENKEKPNSRKLAEQPWQQTKAEMWDELETTLCDLWFLDAKVMADQLQQLQKDYDFALTYLPEAQEEKKEEERRQQRIKKYTDDLIAYAKGEIKKLEIIPSVEPWTEEKINSEIERIKICPRRLDKIKSFQSFINIEKEILRNCSHIKHYCFQLAYNYADSGPVSAEAENKLFNPVIEKSGLLIKQGSRPKFNPHPLLLKVFEEYGTNRRMRNPIIPFAISHDFRITVIADDYKPNIPPGIRILDMNSGAYVKKLMGHSLHISCVYLTPDGQTAVSSSYDKTLRFWNIRTGKCFYILETPMQIKSFSISPDLKTAAIIIDSNLSTSNKYDIYVWDIANKTCKLKLSGHQDQINCLEICPDGKFLASGSSDRTIRIWELEKGGCEKVLNKHINGVESISITPDFRIAISGAYHGRFPYLLKKGESPKHMNLIAWNLQSGSCIMDELNNDVDVLSVSLTPDGNIGLSGNRNNNILVWDIESKACIQTLTGHTESIGCVKIAPDGRKAITIGGDHIRIWDIEKGINSDLSTSKREPVERKLEGILSIIITNNINNILIAKYGQNNVHVVDFENAIQRIFEDQGHMICLSADQSIVVINDWQRIAIFDFISGKKLKELPDANTNMIVTLQLISNGRYLISNSSDKTSRIWDIEKGVCIFETNNEVYDEGTNCLCISPEDKLVASSGNEDILIWEISTGEKIKFQPGPLHIKSIKFSPDGRYLLFCGSNVISGRVEYTIYVYSIKSWTCLNILNGHFGEITDAIFSPDGNKIISCSHDQTIRIWDVETEDCLQMFKDAEKINCVAQDNNNIIYGTDQGKVGILNSTISLIAARPFVTAGQIWKYSKNGQQGELEDKATALCPFCHHRFAVLPDIVEYIKSINKEFNIDVYTSSCIVLPNEVWERSTLRSNCPICNSNIRFNPFFTESNQFSEIISEEKRIKKDQKLVRPLSDEMEEMLNNALDADRLGDQKIAETLYIQVEKQLIENNLLKDHLFARVLNNYGSLLVEQNRFEEAEPKLINSTHISSIYVNPWYWLAKLYQKRKNENDRELEKEAWEKYLELCPTSEDKKIEAEKRLKELS